MKAAYTGWTGSTPGPRDRQRQLEQSLYGECKFLGYDTVENFAFIRDYYADNPQELIDLTKKCGVELVNLYGHFTFDVEEAIRIAKAKSTSAPPWGSSGITARTPASATTAPASAPLTRRCWIRCAM